ncbi:MAG: hypothetical protein K1W02_00450 [Muribaculaceae bacterium]|mgnify:CR=1
MKGIKERLEEWLKSIATGNTLPKDIVAVNIGMFETDGGYGVYLCGSDEYDEEDSDWACEPAYEIPDDYLMLTGDVFESMDWETFQNDIVEALKEILTSDGGIINRFIGTRINRFIGKRIVTTGFDDGDLIRIK